APQTCNPFRPQISSPPLPDTGATYKSAPEHPQSSPAARPPEYFSRRNFSTPLLVLASTGSAHPPRSNPHPTSAPGCSNFPPVAHPDPSSNAVPAHNRPSEF